MTQIAEVPRSSYVGDGSTAAFATGFTFELAAEVVVTVGGVVKAIGVDFDLSGVPSGWIDSGCDVVFRAGAIPAAAAVVLVERSTPRDQPEAFGDEERFSPAQVEALADRLTRMIQEALLAATTGEPGPTGPPGAQVELQVFGGYIQWRRAGEVSWTDLVALADITGPTGPGVPAGGAGATVLRKLSGSDYDTGWSSLASLGALLAASNLSDLANAATARTNLGVAIGSNVQAYSANLTTFASIAPSANVQTLLGAADYAAFRTSLGLVIGTNVQAYNANLTTFAGIAPSANVQTLLGAVDYTAFRTSLGLVIGTNVQAWDADLDALAALSGTNTLYYRSAANTWSPVTIGANLTFSAGTLDANSVGGGGGLLAANNLSDVANVATARSNLGLAIGTNVQAYSANLTTFAGIAPSANVQTLLGSVDYAAFRTSLGLVIGTNVQAYSANLTTFAGIAPSANVQTLLGAADYAAFRTSLSLVIGTNVQAYNANLTTFAGIAPSANVQTLLGAADYTAFRTSLGLVIGTNVQAWDADLDALAALSGTNTLYYRSAANTWSPVSLGTGVAFSGGVLTATGTVGGSSSFFQTRIYCGSTVGTFNVNSTSYIALATLCFNVDLTTFPATHYRIIISGNSNEATKTVTAQLATFLAPTTAIHTGGNDVVVTNTAGVFDSGWLTRDDAATGLKEYCLTLKGSSATVDLLVSYIDVLFKIV